MSELRVSRQLTPLVPLPRWVGSVHRVPAEHSDSALCGVNSGSPNAFGPASRRRTAVIRLLDSRNGPLLRLIVCEGRGQLTVGIGLLLKRCSHLFCCVDGICACNETARRFVPDSKL